MFKVSDKHTGEVICMKVIKEVNDDRAFNTLQNAVKEINFSETVSHFASATFLATTGRRVFKLLAKKLRRPQLHFFMSFFLTA